MIRATEVTHIHGSPADTVTLTYEDRFKRRVVMDGDNGLQFLLDLPKVCDLREGDDLLLEDGRHVRVAAAAEPLLRISGDDSHHLTRLVWHIGNRHLPCEIHGDHVLIRPDHVIADMITKLGGTVEEISAPFIPEGGAYGHGRTHSHEH